MRRYLTSQRLAGLRPALLALGLAAALLLAWQLAPLAGDLGAPLGLPELRWAAVAAVLVVAALASGWRAWRSARRQQGLLHGLAGAGEAGGDAEVALIDQRFGQALAQLRRWRAGGRSRWRAALAGRPRLYQLPWYVIIGAPGAGKTTALVNSGLEFPLADRMGRQALRGIGGTRHCDWWFTSEAVLIDTAGRYTTHDSDAAADRTAWQGFLQLLARYRPRRPLNGVLLTLSASDLLAFDAAQRRAHAGALRQRIDELQTALRIRLPVYLLVTKTDLLAGFVECFADLEPEERAQVWGVTFPHGARRDDDPAVRIASDLAGLEKRLGEHLIERLHAESDLDRRVAAAGFPAQWRLLRDALLDAVPALLAPATAGGAAPMLRGVYFTSGTQEGTPVDRALGAVARTLGLAGAVAPARRGGKAFFVTRLLRDVVFAEAGLAGTHQARDRGRRWLEGAAVAAGVLVVAAGVALALQAGRRNAAHIDAVRAELAPLQQAAERVRRAPRDDLVTLLPVLETLERLGEGGAPAFALPGLDRAEMLAASARAAQQRMLHDTLLPRLGARLEDRLRQPQGQGVQAVYEALRAYLMLFDGAHFDAGALSASLAADWEATWPASVTPMQRAGLRRQLDLLLAGGEVGTAPRADPAVVAQARQAIAGVPLAERAWRRLQQLEPAGAAAAPLTLDAAAGPAARRVFVRASGRPIDLTLPALYSRAAYTGGFQRHAREVLAQFDAERDWVMGGTAPAGGPEALAALEQRYLADYAARWDDWLQDLRLRRPADLADGAALAAALGRPDSPLVALMRTAVRETSLEALPPHAGASAERFAALRRFVEVQPPAAERLQAQLARLGDQLAAATKAAQGAGAATSLDALPALGALAAEAPPPVRGMVDDLLGAVSAPAFAAARAPLARQVASELAPACKRLAEGRYPLARGAREELSREDFARLFAAGGLIDGFFQRQVAPLADVSTRPWRWQGASEGAEGLSPFMRAQAIRDAWFRDGGRQFGLRFELRLLELDPALAEFALDIDGQVARFKRDQKAAFSLQWPGAQDSRRIALQVTPAAGGAPSTHAFEGPWALLRLLDRVRVVPGATPDRAELRFDVEGRLARFELKSATPVNPLLREPLEQFACPQRL